MSGSQNWRQENDAVTYFGNRKKQGDIDTRRPVIRRASDLAGPGIAANATRITDYNDVLARYNGFFSSASAMVDGVYVGAANEPPSSTPESGRLGFVGFVASDESLGGVQVFTDLSTGDQYSRRFLRSEFDPTAITWYDWLLIGPYRPPV